MALDFSATFKLLVLGDSNVGKTCIVHRYCDERYYDIYISTIGIDFKQKIINLDGVPIKLQIWDTAGQERFRTLTTAYYRGAMGIILMYDITNLESFNHLSYWLRNIQEYASPDVIKVLVGNKCDVHDNHRAVPKERGQKNMARWGFDSSTQGVCDTAPQTMAHLLACPHSCDLRDATARAVTTAAYTGHQDKRIADDFDMPFFEVSCKNNVNIEDAFVTLARMIREYRDSKADAFELKERDSVIKASESETDVSKCSC